MKKVVVSLLVVMMALAFSMTGVVSAQTCPATTTTAACPATTTAQCTSATTSACCTPCPVVCCPVVKCPTVTCPTPCPAVVCCVATTKCVETVVVKEVVKPVKAAEATQFSKGSVESPQTIVENNVKQSNTGSQTATININTGDNSDWDGDVNVYQTQDQTNVVKTKVDNTNVDKTTTMSDVNIKSNNVIDSNNNETEVEGNTVVVPTSTFGAPA